MPGLFRVLALLVHPNRHLKKIDVFHEGTPEKFLFVVDKWLKFNEQDHADILPFVEGHGKKFSIMFQLNFHRYSARGEGEDI